ncbi:putative heat shock protein HslVU, ATPase subunit HslU [Trypanosoma theileri]|uniref:Putative heat shock protein HslVU, ATPase subunit HslU n=1 Tax=Trypanosoma theileri TaxID=67003 RepID=A0A1X0P0R0_9TRYP|nr:putative heat shock protein HslVU, ATPase subunit HslU [Trypanosoma theileri]ORC90418.1 putative heat shock protein HslVU, ATPase subunit HslU [Trypanosoma theileri]
MNTQNELRILVVGDTGVGKTLFLRRLRHAMMPEKDDFNSTWGPTVGYYVEVILTKRQQRFQYSSQSSNENSSVAFIELGGNRNFGRSGQFPISLMSFGGVIFVYDRNNANSAIGLSQWYEDLKNYGIVGNSGGAKVMLLETVLTPENSFSMGNNNWLPDELVGSYLEEKAKKSSFCQRSIEKIWNSSFSRINMLKLSVSDFQQQQQQQQQCSLRLRISILLFHLISRFEGLLLFIVAVILFGPSQQSLPFHRPSVTESLMTITGDVNSIVTLEACPLYDQLQFEAAAVESVMSFIGSLRST